MNFKCMADLLFMFNKHGGCDLDFLEKHRDNMFYKTIYEEPFTEVPDIFFKINLVNSSKEPRLRIEWMAYILAFILGHRLEVCKRNGKEKTYLRFHFMKGGKKYKTFINLMFGEDERAYDRQGVMNITKWFGLLNFLKILWPIEDMIANRKIVPEEFERDLVPEILNFFRRILRRELTLNETENLIYIMRHGFSLRTIDGDYLIFDSVSKTNKKYRKKLSKRVKTNFVAARGCEPLDKCLYDSIFLKYIMHSIGKMDGGAYRRISIELGRMHKEEWERYDLDVEKDEMNPVEYNASNDHWHEYSNMIKVGMDPNIPENLNIMEISRNLRLKGLSPLRKRELLIKEGVHPAILDTMEKNLRRELLERYGEKKVKELECLENGENCRV